MRARRWTIIASVTLALAGCKTLDETPPAVEPGSEVHPPAAKGSPPVAKVVPAPAPPAPPESVSPPAPVAPQVARASEVDALLSDFEKMRRLSATELAREQETARQAFNQLRSDAARVRLAMVIGVPGGPGSDGAVELLDPLVKNPAAPLHGLALLLASYIQENRRLVAQSQGLQQNVQGLQQNVQALQQKLDALRTLERSLTEREAAGARRR